MIRKNSKRLCHRTYLVLVVLFIVFQATLLVWVEITHSPQPPPDERSSHFNKPQQHLNQQQQQQHHHQQQQTELQKETSWLCSKITGTLLHDDQQRQSRGFSRIWKTLQPTILEGLRHPRDTLNVHANWTQDLLQHLLTPHVLEYSIKGMPHPSVLRPIVTKLVERLRYPRTRPQPEGPIKIVVFGGSVVEGVQCRNPPFPHRGPGLDYKSLQECSWPFRLERVVNHVIRNLLPVLLEDDNQTQAGRPDIIQIHNLAAGGTNSEAALPLLRYNLGPALLPNSPPDIIINAYSANDNLPPAFHATKNTTIDSFHLARIWKRNVQFVQAAKASQKCRVNPPLILYVNDYLGNQQQSIVGESQLDQAIQWITDFDATVGYVSISHSVRRWVFANTSEHFFSGRWGDRKRSSVVDVHFGQAGHVSTTIAVLYYLFKALYNYCEDENEILLATSPTGIATPTTNFRDDATYFVDIQEPTQGWIEAQEFPVVRPNLTERRWDNLPHYVGPNCSEVPDGSPPCVFAFLAAPLGVNNFQDVLTDYLKRFTLHQEGWSVHRDIRQGGFQNKVGLVATKPGASMTLAYPDSSQIGGLTVHYLKSYGPLWEDSRLEMRARYVSPTGDVAYEKVMLLEGFHNQTVSISYTYSTSFTPMDGQFQLQLTLVGGQQFKLNAMMFCREAI